MRRCRTCNERQRERGRARRAKNRAAGLCDACGKRPPEKYGRCGQCIEAARPAAQAYAASGRGTIARRDAAGLCLGCGGPRDGKQKRCSLCRGAINAAQNEKNREARGLL